MPKRTDIKSILILGAGPIVIGQACEFDYSGAQACKALREEGYRVILVNSNPATIMTDPEMADATYIEPIHWEVVRKIIEKERPDAVLPTMGGQTALNCALELERQGALVIDCDAVYHELLASNTAMLAEINARFPGTIENGTLQRKRLGAVVFADAAALDDLNAITHRYVRAEVRARLRAWARQGGTVAAIDAIALIESGLAELCTVTIGVTAPREVRIERLIAREGVTRDYAEARIDAQKPNEWFAQHCSYVLDNGGTLADFQRRCHQLIQEVLS